MIRLAVRCEPEYAEHVMANLLELATADAASVPHSAIWLNAHSVLLSGAPLSTVCAAIRQSVFS